MPDPSHQHLFEHLQEMLEKHTEYLHELVLPISEKSDVDVSAVRIRNFTNLTHQFTQNLLDGVEQYFGPARAPGHISSSINSPPSPQSHSGSLPYESGWGKKLSYVIAFSGILACIHASCC